MSNHDKGRFGDHDNTGATATANSNSNDEIEMKKNVDMHVCSDESSGTGIELDDQNDEVKVQHEHSSSSDHDIFDGDGDGDGDEENDADNADARNDKVVDEDGGIDSHKNHHRLTICMPCRTECGYCHGDRLYTLAIDNPSRIVLEQEDEDEDEDEDSNGNGNGNYNGNIPNSFSCDNGGTNTCTTIPKKMMKKRVLIRRRHNRLHKRRDKKHAQTDGVSNKNGEEQIIESAETILDHSDTSYHHLEPEPDIVVLEIEQENENENGNGTGTGKHKDKSTTKTPITKSTTSDAYALHFFSLSVQAYQSMINRGWRRSGNLLYKPKNWTSCCATLPIRLDVNLFDDCTNAPEREREREREPPSLSKDCKARRRRGGMSKSQKKVLKRWNKVLNGTGGLNSRSASAKTNNANANTNGRRTGINENRTKSKVEGEGRLDDNVNTSTDNDAMKVESSGFNPKRQKHQLKLQTPNQNQQPKTISNSANTKRISKSQQNQQMQSYAKRILKQNNHDHPLILQMNKEMQTIVSQLLETNTDTDTEHRTGISNNLGNTNNGHLSSPPLSLSASQYNRILEKQCQLKLTRVSKSKYQDQHTRERRTSTSDAADGMNGLLEGTVISQASKSLTTVETEVHLSNSIGPSLHGISKGKMDQVHTSEAIVSHLNNSNLFAVFDDENGGDSQSDDHRDNTKSDRPYPWKNASVRIKEISLHEKSAHVHVVLMVSFGIDLIKDLDLDLDLQETTSSNVTCTASNETGSTRTPNNHEALGQSEANPQNEKTVDRLKENDIIREFIMTHYQSTLTKEEEESLAPPYKFTVRSISAQQSGRMPEVHQLYCRYQRSVHGDEDPYDCAARVDHNKDSKQVKTDTALQTDTTMEDMDHDADGANVEDNTKKAETQNALTKEDFRRLYPLYKDSCIEKIYKGYDGFHKFLCASPLLPLPIHNLHTAVDRATNPFQNQQNETETNSKNANCPFDIDDKDVQIPYGSHHQHYMINDKYLIAVGVVDILPHCLSSVYLFYDPVLSETLSLGKLSALYEIEWVKRAFAFRPELKYYYLGYYIHSCQKMKYKAEYKPSELCCPARNCWVDYEVAKKRLETRSPIRNCCNISSPDNEYFVEESNKGDDIRNGTSKKFQHTKECEEESSGESATSSLPIDDILFDIGAQDYLTIKMVTDEAKDILRPLLEEFVREIGHDIGKECILELCS